MKIRSITWLVTLAIVIGVSLIAQISSAQQQSPRTVPIKMVVSVEAKRGKDVPTINREDVRVFRGHDQLQVTGWTPFQGSQGGLELFLIIDDASTVTITTQFDDIRRFMNEQPNTTAIAVGYIQNGTVHVIQNFTTDRSATGKALRIPLGAAAGGSSPYLAVTDALKHWPESSARHTIFLVSDGIDPLQPGPIDSYLDESVAQAQRTGTQIYAIYASQAGHFGHTLWRINQGQSNLSQLTDKSGGEAYFEGLETPISFAPFLGQFADRLNHQYMLTFLANPTKKASLQHVRLETEVPNAELVSAESVYIPAEK